MPRDAQPSALPSWSENDLHWFHEGRHLRLYRFLGAHLGTQAGHAGVAFAVWAPNADAVSVIGDFNGWDRGPNPLQTRGGTGIWEGFIPAIAAGALYKFAIRGRDDRRWREKADPFAFAAELPPRTASEICDPQHSWGDADWMRTRGARNAAGAPVAIYEVHLGSWMRAPNENHRHLTYRELAVHLPDYLDQTEFTHVEFLPIMEHPFYGSWGYQTTGYFAPTRRYGSPEDFMFLVDHLHQRGYGVLLDWVPSHFPNDPHGLADFDGTHLFEHADPRQGFHPDWKSCVYNYGRHEVRSFLLSNAIFWLDRYHIDGIRVDAVASMLYLDYSRQPGEWIPNRFGGRENLEALSFLRQLNEDIYREFPDVQTIAEESTDWPMVSRPTYLGGLGFGMKWDMGWMHDTLRYFTLDPLFRQYHHNELTFRQIYAGHENFVLPLSHDEVVHGKGSLLGRMPGDEWQRFANLRLLFGYQYGQTGKKLIFMGGEFGQVPEWNHDSSLDWDVLQYPVHAGLQRWVADLNRAYRGFPALHALDFEPQGFSWIDCHDAAGSILSWIRFAPGAARIVIICNFTPVPRHEYRVGVPRGGYWREILNSDATVYAGSGIGNLGGVNATGTPAQGQPDSLVIALPPLAVLFFASES